MTIDSMTLQALVEKASDADFLREMIEVISNRLMQMEVESLTGAAHGERSASRINQRNGYRERQWETRVGTAHLAFPKEHWPQLHSTNPLERLNGEIKRRTDVVAIFPNEAAIVRLVGALLLEQNDEWAASRARYMSLEKLAQLGDDPQARPRRIPAA